MRTRRLLIAVVFVTGVLTTGAVAGAAVVDPDGDGETALAELRGETDPFEADTDGDGVGDGVEKKRGTSPTDEDTDSDNLNDGEEMREYGTDPLESDTDSDGLEDGAEINVHDADPLKVDSDGDGLEDGSEVHEFGSDPTDTQSDIDGLADGVEVNQYGTDPTEGDTDGDGLFDDIEIEVGSDPTVKDTDSDGLDDYEEFDEYDTDPAKKDTDGDGLDDGGEVNEYGTDPNDADTDDDGLEDGWEVHRNELFPNADPLRTDIYVEVDTMKGTTFDRDEADRIVSKFKNAPISNPDGSAGASLHFVYDSQQIPHETSADADSLRHYSTTHFDRLGEGYHYLAIVDEVSDSSSRVDTLGMGTMGYAMAESQSSDGETGSIVMHELGHSLGLGGRDFDGVDSSQYSFGEYPSVMNYNSPSDYYGYSTGENGVNDFDDWRYIETQMYTPGVIYVD